jgi:hypothetical protein
MPASPSARRLAAVALAGAMPLLVAAPALQAQGHVHTPGMTHPAPPAAVANPSQAGSAPFAAIAEVVALLEADPATDWSRVRIDRLRDHLVDMHRVTVDAEVAARDVPGGAAYTVTGRGATVGAIQRMTAAHGAMLNAGGALRVITTRTPAGARVVITAADPGDARAVARVRGLGFHGFLVLDNHHGPHHLALARGEAMPDHSGAHGGHTPPPASRPTGLPRHR